MQLLGQEISWGRMSSSVILLNKGIKVHVSEFFSPCLFKHLLSLVLSWCGRYINGPLSSDSAFILSAWKICWTETKNKWKQWRNCSSYCDKPLTSKLSTVTQKQWTCFTAWCDQNEREKSNMWATINNWSAICAVLNWQVNRQLLTVTAGFPLTTLRAVEWI